jgi:hypothetical protein
MTNKALTTEIFIPAGPVSRGDILAAAILELRADGKLPVGTLPDAEIKSAKKSNTKDKHGTTFTVSVKFREPAPGESSVTVDDVIAGMQTPDFDPSDHNDEA